MFHKGSKNSEREEASPKGRSYNKEWCISKHELRMCKTNVGNLIGLLS